MKSVEGSDTPPATGHGSAAVPDTREEKALTPSMSSIKRINLANLDDIIQLDESLVLNHTNWVAWYVHITKIFQRCGVEGYVNGTLICPDHNVDSEGARKWDSNDAYAQVIISMNVTPTQYMNIPMCDNAHEMWEYLECGHRSQAFRTLFAYRRRLCQTVAGENDNVVEHLDKLKKYRQQMNFVALCNKRFAISDSSINMIIADSLPHSWDHFKGPYIEPRTRSYIGDAEPGTMISSQRFIEVIEEEFFATNGATVSSWQGGQRK